VKDASTWDPLDSAAVLGDLDFQAMTSSPSRQTFTASILGGVAAFLLLREILVSFQGLG